MYPPRGAGEGFNGGLVPIANIEGYNRPIMPIANIEGYNRAPIRAPYESFGGRGMYGGHH